MGWTDYTPDMSATTTPMTWGTGAMRYGRYLQDGNGLVTASFVIRPGSGWDPGEGLYLVKLPVNANAGQGSWNYRAVGHVTYGIVSSPFGTHHMAAAHLYDRNPTWAVLAYQGGLFVSQSSPGTMANIHGLLVYQAA